MIRVRVLLAVSFVLASSLLLVGSALAADPTISITPDTSVFVSSGDSVRIWILASDPDPLDTITVEKSFGAGTYVPRTELAPIYDEFFFQPDTAGLYTFIFPVTDEGGATGADTTLVLAKKVDFSQSANDDSPYPPGDVHWLSGAVLRAGNSNYYEGMSSLQRLVFINIPKTAGDVHTLNLSHQATKDTIHAYDFLTSWPQGVQAGNEIGGPTMFVSINECGPDIGPPANLGAICAALHTSGFTATPDAPDAMGTLLGDDVASKTAAYETQLGNRTIKIYGNAAISAASLTFNGYAGSPEKHADYTLTWTSSSDSIVIEMAGHLAAGTDPPGQAAVGYGSFRGCGAIPGASYHFKLSTLDGASLGSQDNQIKDIGIMVSGPECNVAPPNQEVCVGFSATFTDNSTGGTPPYTYCWQKSPYTAPCTSSTNQLAFTPATLADAGDYRVIVTDANSLADTCYAALTVHDQPVCEIIGDSMVCPGSTTELCATDDPDYEYLWSTAATTRCITVGTEGIYWVAVTDENGCADTCYFNLTVDDTEPPVALCPDDITLDNEPGQCGAVASFSIDATDDCPGVSVSSNPISGSFFPVGTTPVEVIATDASGNGDTCYFDVTVNESEPPVAQCPDDITQSNDQGQCSAAVSFTVDATDNCPGVTVAANPASGSTFPVGTTPVEVIATDASGNADTCHFNVTINDTEPPVAQCPDDITQGNDPGQCDAVVSFTIDATDNCPGVTVTANPASGSTLPLGTSTVEVIATDASGNADTCYFNVTVNESEPPVAQCPDHITVNNDLGQCSAAVSFTIDATDNCPGVSVSSSPVSGSTFPVGATTPVEVIATDASGNADTC
ncbi:MAG: HYR domain-containing protein, partial [Candidatus Zixiibacteriota bacterium]